MRHLLRGIVLIVLLGTLMIALAGCSRRYQSAEALPSSVRISATYYTQVGMHFYKGRHWTTNYAVGMFVPVNTPVELVKYGDNDFIISIQSTREELEIVNVYNFSKWSLNEAFEKLLGPQQVSLLKFNALERDHIANGTIGPGMRKSAVIVARGYPPSHETPSLERDLWTYWRNRWDKMIVEFENDLVVGMKD